MKKKNKNEETSELRQQMINSLSQRFGSEQNPFTSTVGIGSGMQQDLSSVIEEEQWSNSEAEETIKGETVVNQGIEEYGKVHGFQDVQTDKFCSVWGNEEAWEDGMKIELPTLREA